MELLKVDTIEEALNKLDRFADQLPLSVENVPHFQSLGHILAEDVVSSENVPGFARSTMDGYAVRSRDTNGASESMPTFLTVKGEVVMGKAPEGEAACIAPGECVYVPTGGMIPEGADAVVMVEYCEAFTEDSIAVYTSAACGNHLVFPGDDVEKGCVLLKRGRRIKPADIGVMSAIGQTTVKVYKPWKIAVFSTGDEIIHPNETPAMGQVRDVNTFALMAQAQSMGFEVVVYDVIMDDEASLEHHVRAAMSEANLIFVSGGSSQGKKDATAQMIGKLASSGVLTHGIAVKPGKPTITGFDVPTQTVLIGLPGHPVAAMMLFRILAGGLWDMATGQAELYDLGCGCSSLTETKRMSCPIGTNIAASPGRKTFQLVQLKNQDGLEAVPILGQSGLIRTLSEADGYIVMDVNDEGLNRGDGVDVILL